MTMTAHEYHATYCRCGGASNADVDAVLAMEAKAREAKTLMGTRCRVRMFVTDDGPGIVCTLPHDHLGPHVMAPMRYVRPELRRSTADKPDDFKAAQ